MPDLYIYRTSSTDPYRNVATELMLCRSVPRGAVILYLWQNDRTVVIGRNQNLRREIALSRLEADGGHAVRRLSGGGAVYHDLGNLNFSFITRDDEKSRSQDTRLILSALSSLGISAEPDGRNDITAAGKKVSGFAYFMDTWNGIRTFCHHGTLLVSENLGDLERYLNPSVEKLASKGIDSVRARVANLTEFCPGLTVPLLADTLARTCVREFGEPRDNAELGLDEDRIAERAAFLASDEWLCREIATLTDEWSGRCPLGCFTLSLTVADGIIAGAVLSTDALGTGTDAICSAAAAALTGCLFEPAAMQKRIRETAGIAEEWQTALTGLIRANY